MPLPDAARTPSGLCSMQLSTSTPWWQGDTGPVVQGLFSPPCAGSRPGSKALRRLSRTLCRACYPGRCPWCVTSVSRIPPTCHQASVRSPIAEPLRGSRQCLRVRTKTRSTAPVHAVHWGEIRRSCAYLVHGGGPAGAGGVQQCIESGGLQGVGRYYLLAQDVFRLGRLRWVMETSMLKTLAWPGNTAARSRRRLGSTRD